MSRRRSYGSSESFEYLERKITLHPTTGKFYVPDYDTQHDTLEQAKAEIKSHQVKRENAPKIPVWFRETGMRTWDRGKFIRGLTSGHVSANNDRQVVVTYTDKRGGFRRMNVYSSSVYPMSPDNDALVARISELDTQIEKFEQERIELENKLEKLTPRED